VSRILIIDDNVANREILRFRLERLGHVVLEAEDGNAGVSEALTTKPDLIFMDVMMPQKDGWQACRELKNDPRSKAAPIVMLTALDQSPDALRRDCGADAYMPKPWTVAELGDILSRWLP